MPGNLDQKFKLSEENVLIFVFFYSPSRICPMISGSSGRSGMCNQVQEICCGLYLEEKIKKQSWTIDEESCLCLKQECSLESQECSGSCLLLPSKIPEHATKPRVAVLLVGGEAFPDSQWVWYGRSFPQGSSSHQAAEECSQSSHSQRLKRAMGLFPKGVASTEKAALAQV